MLNYWPYVHAETFRLLSTGPLQTFQGHKWNSIKPMKARGEMMPTLNTLNCFPVCSAIIEKVGGPPNSEPPASPAYLTSILASPTIGLNGLPVYIKPPCGTKAAVRVRLFRLTLGSIVCNSASYSHSLRANPRHVNLLDQLRRKMQSADCGGWIDFCFRNNRP